MLLSSGGRTPRVRPQNYYLNDTHLELVIMAISGEARKGRLDDIQQIMALKLTASPTAIHRYLQEANIDIPKSSVANYIKECRDANWLWLTDAAKHTYIANMRQRAEDIQEAIEHTMTALRSPDLKPHARAQLNNSLGVLSKEMSDLIEGQGILRHWDAILNAKDPAWQNAAMQADTSDADAQLT